MTVLFLIFLDQICPKWIKLDQTWSNWISRQSKNVTIKSCHIYKKDKNGCLILDFFGSDLSKMDQTWLNLIKLDFSPIKKCYYRKLSHLQKGYLNYYLSFDVCPVSVWVSVFLQKKNSYWLHTGRKSLPPTGGEQTSRILEFKPEGLDF